MTYKELKELINNAPDNEEVSIELHRENGEYIYAVMQDVDLEDYCLILKEDIITIDDVLSAISSEKNSKLIIR